LQSLLFRSPNTLSRVASLIAVYRQTSFSVADFVAEHGPTSRYYTWFAQGDVAAFCRTDETSRRTALYLSSFVVAPAFRGAGLARPFLDGVLADAKIQGHDRILLKVHEDNVAAQRLYENAGFQTQQKWNKRYEMERLV
jgi:ribosomal protein S18 acetylase RimI-like enzyme